MTSQVSTPAERAGSGNSSVGTLLRACRERAGFELDELSRHLRIRRRFLEAIEEGRMQALPGATYAVGFVRTYAEYFGLDGNEIVRRFRAETGEKEGTPALNFPVPVTEGGTPKAAIIFIGLLVAAVAYGLWYINAVRDNAIVELVYPVPERLKTLAQDSPDGQTAAVSGDQPQTSQAIPPVATPPSAVPTVGLAAPQPSFTPPPEPASAAAAPPQPGAATKPQPQATTEAAAPALPTTDAPPAAASGSGRIVLRATGETWVQIRDRASKSVLLSRTLAAGEEYIVPDRPGLTLVTGNAGGIEVLLDGERLPPLGQAGTVRRNVVLDAEALRQATATAN